MFIFYIFSLHNAGHVFRGVRPSISVNKTRASVRVWAWFTSDGGGSIALLNHLSENQFLELVEEELIPQAVARFGTGPVRFVNDGESRVPFETFNQFQPLISFRQLRWPAQSKHLSPFVTIWPLIEQSIRGSEASPEMPKNFGTMSASCGSEGLSNCSFGKDLPPIYK